MSKQDQDKENKFAEGNCRALLEILKKLDDEEFILNLPVEMEGTNHERAKSV